MDCVNFYKENGYYLAEGLLDEAALQTVLIDIWQVFGSKTHSLQNLDDCCVDLFRSDFDAFVSSAAACQQLLSLQQLFFDTRVTDFIYRLGLKVSSLNTRPVLHLSSKNTAKNDLYWKVPPHQDWPSNQGSLNGLTCWVPLVDVPEELGPLEVVPASHTFGSLPHQDVGVPALIEEFWDWVPVPMHRGDVLFFSTFLVHRSGENKSDKIRFSTATRYNDLSEPSYIARNFPKPPELSQRFASWPSREEVRDVWIVK